MKLFTATLVTSLLGLALGDQQWHTPYSENTYTSEFENSYGNHDFGVRQGLAGVNPVVAAMGIGVANAGFTSYVGLTNSNNIQKNKNDVTSHAAKSKTVCNKVNEVLNVAELTTSATNLKAVKDFKLTKIIIGGAPGSGTATINGKAFAHGTTKEHVVLVVAKKALDAHGENVAVTAKDFDSFRSTVDKALLELQAKIDSILAISTVTC